MDRRKFLIGSLSLCALSITGQFLYKARKSSAYIMHSNAKCGVIRSALNHGLDLEKLNKEENRVAIFFDQILLDRYFVPISEYEALQLRNC
jgi:hypothetical protein